MNQYVSKKKRKEKRKEKKRKRKKERKYTGALHRICDCGSLSYKTYDCAYNTDYKEYTAQG